VQTNVPGAYHDEYCAKNYDISKIYNRHTLLEFLYFFFSQYIMGDRLITVKAFGNRRTQYMTSNGSGIRKGAVWPITPFRAAMNAGDLAGSTNSGVLPYLPAPSQGNGIGNMSKHFNVGGQSTGESAFTGNQKFVYDGSDYIRFKKLQAASRERVEERDNI
jgi:hypothetical protein